MESESLINLRIELIEKAINQEVSFNRLLLLAGEWYGLKQVIGTPEEGPWAMLHRVKGI